MNSGQSLLSLGALLILALTVLRVNNSIISTETVMQDSKFGILATSLATSLIEKASKKAFDANTYDDAVSSLGELTSAAGLGPNVSETPDTYNDFDDYDGYSEEITNLPSAEFNIFCEVVYISPNNPDGKLTTTSWHKKMIVSVSSPSTTDTIRLSTIYSYWHFR
ncbi:MAG: hypothetical protein ACHQLA_05160 [Ignavibacteriales bacterium]